MLHGLPQGEKIVLQAFFLQEMEERAERNKMLQEAAKQGFFCPNMI